MYTAAPEAPVMRISALPSVAVQIFNVLCTLVGYTSAASLVFLARTFMVAVPDAAFLASLARTVMSDEPYDKALTVRVLPCTAHVMAELSDDSKT